jgi:hypothetical protein
MRALAFVAIAGCGASGFDRPDAPHPIDAPGVGTDATAVPVPRTGLVAEWLFTGGVSDTSGHTYNAMVKGAVLVDDRFGHPMSACHFDGTGASIEIQDTAELALVGDATISVWIKPDALRRLTGIVSKYQFTGDNSYTLRLGFNAPFGYYDFDNTALGAAPPAMIVPGHWQHVAVVIKGGKVVIYANGAPGTPKSPGYPIMATSHPLRIGVDYSSRYFAGAIDDVRLYSRALEDFEIEALYAEHP